MKKNTILAVLLLITLCVGLMLGAQADDNGVYSISFGGHNVAFEDSVYLVYLVNENDVPTGAETGVLLWKNAREDGEYIYGNQEYILTEPVGVDTGSGKTLQKYYFTELAAKEMTTDVYAVAYFKVGNAYTYSKLDKYSVLQYAYNKKGSTTVGKGGLTLGELMTAMLDYGAAAQQYFGVNTDRLANGAYYQVTVEGGTLPDGTTKGLYAAGTVLTLTTDIEGAQWKDDLGKPVNTTVTVPARNVTYSAGESVTPPTADLAFTQLGDGTYAVSGIGSVTDTDIVIPATYNGKAVTAIGKSAFQNCSTITSVTIPDSVTSIGGDIFQNCTKLEKVYFQGTVEQWRNVPGVSNLSSDYINCSNAVVERNGLLYSYTIADGTTAIPDGKFSYEYMLTEVTIPDSVTRIGGSAFESCSSLRSVTIPDGVTIIDDYAFCLCESLQSIDLPDGLQSIGEGAFSHCSSLDSINLPDSVTSIGKIAFSTSHLRSIAIPDGITAIKDGTFSECEYLTSVELPASVTSIGQNAFDCCYALTDVYFGGTEAQWAAIMVDCYYNDPLLSATIHYNYNS